MRVNVKHETLEAGDVPPDAFQEAVTEVVDAEQAEGFWLQVDLVGDCDGGGFSAFVASKGMAGSADFAALARGISDGETDAVVIVDPEGRLTDWLYAEDLEL